MLLSDIQAKVDVKTNRPELTDDRNLAIQEATIALHSMEMWWRDTVEQRVIFQTPDFFQQIPISSLPRFRIFKYIRKYDPNGTNPVTNQNTGVALEFFKPRAPDKILDPRGYGVEEDFIYYLSGGAGSSSQVCQLRSWSPFQYLLIGWQTLPIVDPLANYSSWIADLFPYAIINVAAQDVLSNVGQTDAAKLLEDNVNRQISLLMANGNEFQGR